MAKTLLLISNRPDDIEFANQVAVTAGLSVMAMPNAVSAVEVLAKDGANVIFVDTSSEVLYQEFETAVQNGVGLFSDKIGSLSIHFISSDELEKVPYLVGSPLFSNFIYRSYGIPKEAGAHYGHIVASMLEKRAFGLQTLLEPGAKIQVVKLTNSNQKQEAVEAIRGFLVAARFQTRMASVIANAVDEILMNAIYDAPIDDVGRPLHKLTSRASTLSLEGKAAVEMHVGFDGKHVGVSTIDLFGSLDKANLVNQISKAYVSEEYKVKGTSASAGIGLATVFRSGAGLFFVSESRVRTEVTVFFKRTENYKDFKSQFRFISSQLYF